MRRTSCPVSDGGSGCRAWKDQSGRRKTSGNTRNTTVVVNAVRPYSIRRPSYITQIAPSKECSPGNAAEDLRKEEPGSEQRWQRTDIIIDEEHDVPGEQIADDVAPGIDEPPVCPSDPQTADEVR